MELELNKEINGEQFLEELSSAGIKVIDQAFPRVEGSKLFVNVAAKDEAKTLEIWDKHIAEDWSAKKAETRKAILDKLGITEEEAKLLLG